MGTVSRPDRRVGVMGLVALTAVVTLGYLAQRSDSSLPPTGGATEAAAVEASSPATTSTARTETSEITETPATTETVAVPALIRSQPEAGAIDVDPQGGFRFQFDGPLADASTMEAALTEVGSAISLVAAAPAMSIDLTRQNLSLAFPDPLAVFTDYRLVLTGLESAAGQRLEPVEIAFRTGPLYGGSDRFEVEKLVDVTGPTAVAFGPSGHGYATTVGGEIIRFEMSEDGLPTGQQTVLVSNPAYQFIALAFEPGTEDRVWVSQWSNDPVDEFSSEIAAYDLSVGAGSERKVVVGLPRHPRGNHSVQGLDFNDGKLYAAVGSVTAGGAWSESFFGQPFLEENPVSASIIEIDPAGITDPIDTSNLALDDLAINDPATDDAAPVRLFATGLRNAYDLVWHRNGNLYSNINQNSGSTDEASPSPTEGPCQGLPENVGSNQISDTLNLVRRGRYYGHPNPSRGECVVMGGGRGPFAVPGYDPDQPADPNFDPDLVAFYATDRSGGFGISVNGIDEYLGSGPLSGALLSADFSGSRSILVVRLGQPTSRLVIDGAIERLATAEGRAATFTHPIDVASSHSGGLMVADFGEWLGGRYGDGGAVYFLEPVSEEQP